MVKLRLGIYAAAHFLVDLGCALLLLGRICPDWNPEVAILLYNLFAFAVQMPVGLLADRLGRCHLFASAGCLLVLLGWMLPPGPVAVITAGLGNAAFHVGGGLNTLNESGRRAGPLGLFVSPGAFGVYLGAILAFYKSPEEALTPREVLTSGKSMLSTESFLPLVVCLSLAVAAVVIWRFGRGTDNAPLDLPRGDFKLWRAAACLLAVVIFRSLLGLAADLPWKTDFGWLAVCAVAGGKAAGGYVADRFGMFPTAMASLCLSAICFLGGNHPAAGLGALFLFNMTMPLTLWAMARLFSGMKGFSFGLLTFGLFLGFLPVYFGWGSLGTAALTAGTILSLPFLVIGLRQAERRKNDTD